MFFWVHSEWGLREQIASYLFLLGGVMTNSNLTHQPLQGHLLEWHCTAPDDNDNNDNNSNDS